MSGAFHTDKYRNVFEMAGYNEKDINERLNDIFNTIFYGSDEERFYHTVGNDMGYLTDTGNHDVRTEGMSYGMMICVQLDKKEEFDRLWKWTKTYMWMSEGVNKGYFAWSCGLDGHKNSYGPAPDGEEYFAMALFFASNRWGDGEGIFHYKAEAKAILHECLHKGEDGSGGKPMWEPSNKLIKFIPECNFSDPSYHLPHFYELFALWANEEDQAFFKEAATNSRIYLQKSCHPVTGLAAEFADYEGKPYTIKHSKSGARHDWYYSDAYRVALNIATDYEWFGKSERASDCLKKLQKFFKEKTDWNDLRAYNVDGTPFEEKALHPTAIIATNAAASLATFETGEYAKEFIDLFFHTPLRTGDRRYYDNCLYLFSFLLLSGNYKIWK